MTDIVAKGPIHYCACARTRGDDEGYRYNPEIGLWVHAPCNGPTRAYVRAVWGIA